MAIYELTAVADRRIGQIYRYSVVNFGTKTARRYLAGLHQAFEMLAEGPQIGTDESWAKSGCRRIVHQSHVIYRPTETGVVILEILHEAQDPIRWLDERG